MTPSERAQSPIEPTALSPSISDKARLRPRSAPGPGNVLQEGWVLSHSIPPGLLIPATVCNKSCDKSVSRSPNSQSFNPRRKASRGSSVVQRLYIPPRAPPLCLALLGREPLSPRLHVVTAASSARRWPDDREPTSTSRWQGKIPACCSCHHRRQKHSRALCRSQRTGPT